jgi:hypothetical protein
VGDVGIIGNTKTREYGTIELENWQKRKEIWDIAGR